MATRLSREARREQLLDLGRAAVTRSSFDDLSLEDVAHEAGISRGLLFHYFPSRRDFVIAIAEQAKDELLAVTDTDPSLDPLTRLRSGLAAYVDHIAAHPDAYTSLLRGAAGGDDAMQAIADDGRQQLAERIITGVGLDPAQVDAIVVVAIRGWFALVEEAAMSWLRDPTTIDRDDLLRLFERSLGAIALQVGDDSAARLGAAILGTPAA